MEIHKKAAAAEEQEIPLFPLQRVLYPSVSLPMQIFEQRYLRLVKESLAAQTAFGVVPIMDGREVGSTPEICTRGTLVNIVDWSQLPNGLLGVVVKGLQRLTVGSTRVEADGLLVGKVRLEAEEDTIPLAPEDMDLVALLIDLARQLGVEEYYLGDNLMAALAASHNGENDDGLLADERVRAELDRAVLVWRLADLLPVARSKKIALFDMADPEARLAEVRGWLLTLQSQ
ncbi:MAG: LON peptidase substrate-binding domain-containing protein [Porticoccaceae bacterium]